jgi:hypothetical protein
VPLLLQDRRAHEVPKILPYNKILNAARNGVNFVTNERAL